MADDPKPPRGPTAWRLYGLLALLALIAILLVLRGCGPEPATDAGAAAATEPRAALQPA